MRKTITLLVTGSMLFVLLIAFFTASWGIVGMRRNFQEVNASMERHSFEGSAHLLEEQIVRRIENIVGEEARDIGYFIASIRANLGLAREHLSRAYRAHPPQAAATPNDGPVPLRLILPENRAAASFDEELAQIAHATEMIGDVISLSAAMTTIVYASESGFALVAGEDTAPQHIDFRNAEWYRAARYLSDDAFYLTGEDIGKITADGIAGVYAATPVFDEAGNLAGVLAGGSNIETFRHIAFDETYVDTAEVFVLTSDGELVFSRARENWGFGEMIGQNLLDAASADIRALAASAVQPGIGTDRIEIDGNPYYLSREALAGLDLHLAVLADMARAAEPIRAASNIIHTASTDALKKSDRAMTAIASLACALTAICFVGALTVARKFSGKITGPLSTLAERACEIGDGNLDVNVDVKTGDEVETLARAIGTMASELKRHIANLTKATAERERIDTELSIARKIQANMLPRDLHTPMQAHVDLHACMIPAYVVGGDFYDFFMIGADKLCVVIADVSGKGVPAALFMAYSKTVLKNRMLEGLAPAAALEAANRELCVNNEEMFFVTVFLGVLQTESGVLTYTNAGHNPPMIACAANIFEPLPLPKGMVLAAFENAHYGEISVKLQPGDRILLYTDGVTEAMNARHELYGETRLLEFLNTEAHKALAPQNLAEALRNDLEQFSGGEEQSDDITMLLMELR